MALKLYKCTSCQNVLWLSRIESKNTLEKCFKCHRVCLPEKIKKVSFYLKPFLKLILNKFCFSFCFFKFKINRN